MDFLSLLSSNDSVTHTHLSSVLFFFFFFFFKHYLFKITHQFIHQLFLKHKKSCTNFSNEVSSNEPGLYVNTQTKKVTLSVPKLPTVVTLMIANEPAVEKNYRLNKSNKRNAHFRKQSLAGCRSVLPISTSHDYF